MVDRHYRTLITAANDFPCPNVCTQNGFCPSVATVTLALDSAERGGRVVP
jgi:hypothetical protein